jgi:hypothetical protein
MNRVLYCWFYPLVVCWHKFFDSISKLKNPNMEKIKNGDTVIYRNQHGIVYGKPRTVKTRGLIYTIRIGDDYVKVWPNEITPAVKD